MTSKHTIRKATTEERKYDCCGDRYPCYIDLVCSCGLKGCRSCIKNHLLELHTAELPSTFGQMTGNLKVPPIVEALGPLTERDLLGFAAEVAAPVAPAAVSENAIKLLAEVDYSGWHRVAKPSAEGDGWIAVTERDKPTGEDHLLSFEIVEGDTERRVQAVGYFNRLTRSWFITGEDVGELRVDYYRPLPAPPSGQGEVK